MAGEFGAGGLNVGGTKKAPAGDGGGLFVTGQGLEGAADLTTAANDIGVGARVVGSVTDLTGANVSVPVIGATEMRGRRGRASAPAGIPAAIALIVVALTAIATAAIVTTAIVVTPHAIIARIRSTGLLMRGRPGLWVAEIGSGLTRRQGGPCAEGQYRRRQSDCNLTHVTLL